MPLNMSSGRDPPVRLYECRGGFLFYELETGQLHFFNNTGLLLWNLLREGIAIELIGRYLAAKWSLQQPPAGEIQSFKDTLSRHGLIAAAEEARKPNTPEVNDEVLWPQSRDIVGRSRAVGPWETPTVSTFPFDALKVTSAKCSSRWVNLDDNTCYAPPAVPAGMEDR